MRPTPAKTIVAACVKCAATPRTLRRRRPRGCRKIADGRASARTRKSSRRLKVLTIEDSDEAAARSRGNPSDEDPHLHGRREAVLALLRGDHELNEVKLTGATKANLVRPAQAEEIKGGAGRTARIARCRRCEGRPHLMDRHLEGRTNMVTERRGQSSTFAASIQDATSSMSRRTCERFRREKNCPRCDGKIDVFRALEVGHIFKLGLRYTKAMGANILGADGKESPIVMGCYGIGVERILAAAVELHHDADGIIWPISIAPYQIALLPLQNDPQIKETTDSLCGSDEGRSGSSPRRSRRATRCRHGDAAPAAVRLARISRCLDAKTSVMPAAFWYI